MIRTKLRAVAALLPAAGLLAGCAPGGGRPAATMAPTPVSADTSPPDTGPKGKTMMPLRLRGHIVLPNDQQLEFFVELDPVEGEYTGLLSIPGQGLYGGALANIVVTSDELGFEFADNGARWMAELVEDGTPAECTFQQSGMTLPCVLEVSDDMAAAMRPPRPQTPLAPFPYDVVEVEYDNTKDGVHLAGTLTIPHGEGKYPAAVLISGSGAQDRDESLMGHKPFWVLADHLSRKGIAVLRVDDRGIGGSTGSTANSVGEELARDIASSVEFLRAHPRISADRVGLIGHSEGGVLGPRVAASDRRIAFVVMMAGTGVPGHEIIREQSAAMLRASGSRSATLDAAAEQQDAFLEALLASSTIEEAREALESGPHAEAAAAVTPWYLDFIRYDPIPALERVRCPVLVLSGTLDLQVLAAQNLPPIRKALSRNGSVEVRRLEGLNHLFQHATTGAPSEYATIEETIAPEVLELISGWIGELP